MIGHLSHLNTEALDIGNQKTDISVVVSDFFDSAGCKPEHIICFHLPSLFPAKVVEFHLFNVQFHNTALCNNIITAYFQEFTTTFPDNCEILGADASKSVNFTAIASCSLTAHFSYRINDLNSVFTAEALAIKTAIDELA